MSILQRWRQWRRGEKRSGAGTRRWERSERSGPEGLEVEIHVGQRVGADLLLGLLLLVLLLVLDLHARALPLLSLGLVRLALAPRTRVLFV